MERWNIPTPAHWEVLPRPSRGPKSARRQNVALRLRRLPRKNGVVDFAREPILPPQLNGTEFDYTLRGTKYKITLSENSFHLQSNEFSLASKTSFGAGMINGNLLFFAGNGDNASLSINRSSNERIRVAAALGFTSIYHI